MEATYTKLRDGSWGLRVTGGKPNENQRLTVRKKSGETKSEVVARVLWTDGNVSLCSISKCYQNTPQTGTMDAYSLRTGPVRAVAWGAGWADRPAQGQARGYVTVRRLGEFRASIECEEHGEALETAGWSIAREHQEAGSMSFCARCQGA